jgi:hypothetical protein
MGPRHEFRGGNREESREVNEIKDATLLTRPSVILAYGFGLQITYDDGVSNLNGLDGKQLERATGIKVAPFQVGIGQ